MKRGSLTDINTGKLCLLYRGDLFVYSNTKNKWVLSIHRQLVSLRLCLDAPVRFFFVLFSFQKSNQLCQLVFGFQFGFWFWLINPIINKQILSSVKSQFWLFQKPIFFFSNRSYFKATGWGAPRRPFPPPPSPNSHHLHESKYSNGFKNVSGSRMFVCHQVMNVRSSAVCSSSSLSSSDSSLLTSPHSFILPCITARFLFAILIT